MRIVSIDGGGYLGLATASFIEGIERHAQTTFHREFDLFCGTSTGAIITLGLASGMTGGQIADLYRSIGNTVFTKRLDVPFLARRCPGFLRAKYSLTPLRVALDEAFGDMTLGDLLAKDKKVLITSYSVTAGRPRIFKTDHSSQLSMHNRYRIADVALASAAAPTYFPLAEVTHPENGVREAFCDGGVVANHPALLGFAEAVFELNTAPSMVKVLSISTPREDLAEPSITDLDRGLRTWRHQLPQILVDSPSSISHQLLKRLVTTYGTPAPLYERIELSNRSCLAFDQADAAATHELVAIGADAAASNETRARLMALWV